MTQPWLLDAYCCGGGATRGYQIAGYRVCGVDIKPNPDYPGDDFFEGDAISFIKKYGRLFTKIHASSPCQAHTSLTKGLGTNHSYPDLINPTRAALREVGVHWVMENVMAASMRRDLVLCGTQFNLRVLRHRQFEFGNGPRVPSLPHISHRKLNAYIQAHRHGQFYEGDFFGVYGKGGMKGSLKDWQGAMGIDWTDDLWSIAQAIPPAYATYIGQHLIQV